MGLHVLEYGRFFLNLREYQEDEGTIFTDADTQRSEFYFQGWFNMERGFYRYYNTGFAILFNKTQF